MGNSERTEATVMNSEGNPQDLPDGFQMTELGPLPKEWRVVRLGEVAIVGPPRIPRLSRDVIPFIPMALIPEGGREVSQYELRAPSDVRSGVVFLEGDLLLAKITPSLENGKQGIVKNIPGGWGYATTEAFPIRANEQLEIDFLNHYLLQPSVREALASKMEGTTGRQRLPKAVVVSLPIPLPPLSEQRAIAHVLRTVQRAKEATDGVIAALKDLKKSLMRHLFTYGPVPVDQAAHVPMQETEIGPLPAHWRVVRLGDLVERGILLMRNGFPQGQHNETGAGVPHLRPFNITNDGILDLSQIKFVPPPSDDDPRWLHPGDVIFNNTNSEELVGKTALFNRDGPFVLSNHMTFLRVLQPGQINSYWLAQLLHLFWHLGVYRALCRRHVNQVSISLDRLKGVRIPLPPLSEQRESARILQAVDAKIAAEERRRAALEELFKTLLQELMSGRRRVNFATQSLGE